MHSRRGSKQFGGKVNFEKILVLTLTFTRSLKFIDIVSIINITFLYKSDYKIVCINDILQTELPIRAIFLKLYHYLVTQIYWKAKANLKQKHNQTTTINL